MSSDETEPPFNLQCIECGAPIRCSRTISTDHGPVDFYEDEDGIENRDFHWHVPS